MRAVFLAAALILPAGLASAASHNQAPMISADQDKVDTIRDVYVFQGDRGTAAVVSTQIETGPVTSVGSVGVGKGGFGASDPTSSFGLSN